MGRSEKRKPIKAGANEQSPNKNVKKKQNLQLVQDEVVDADSNQLSQSKDIGVQNRETTQEIAEDEDEDGNNALVASNIQLAAGGDVIGRCRVLPADRCPYIPLCRLLPHAKVRGLRKDVSSLKTAFASEKYVPEKGTFVVSTCLGNGEETLVTDTIRASWDPMWLEIDQEFEKEVSFKRELKFMSKKMFFVWEGNHRTKAWMEVITELFKEDKARHVRVMCTLIDPRKVPEIALLASLQRMNVMNEHAVIKPLLRDVLINTSNICGSDSKEYIESLKEEENQLLKGCRSKETWFPFSRGYLARLVFQVEYNKEVASAKDVIERTMPEEQWEDALRKEKSKIQKRLSDRMGKVLLCLHPKLGEQWKKILFDLQFEGRDSYVTLEKLRLLATSDLQTEKRVRFLKLLEAPRITREQYLIPTREADFKGWLVREMFLDRVESMAVSLLESLLDSMEDPPTMPQDPTLRKYFDGVKFEARKYMFQMLRSRDARGDLKAGKSINETKENKSMELEKAAQRIVFRFFKHLVVAKKLLDEMPPVCKAWCKVGDSPLCMFPSTMHGLSKWEIENCPWWVDFPPGNRLEEEMNMYELHAGKKAMISTSTLDIEASKTASKKGKAGKSTDHSREDTQVQDCVEIIHEHDMSGDTTLAKESITYLHNGPSKIKSHRDSGFESKFGCCVGDYIQMGRDFEKGKRNEAYGEIHEFFCLHACKDHQYRREGRDVKWAAGLVFIDFPTGMVGIDSGGEVPLWDMLTEDHVRYGIAIGAASLDDVGWLVMISPLEGPCLTWIEKYTYCQGLIVARRVVMGSKIPYGGCKLGNNTRSVRCSLLIFAHRMDCHPALFLEDSKHLFKDSGLRSDEDFWAHYMPESKKIQHPQSSRPIRGAVQKSMGFMACVLRACCLSGGFVIDMGCGTAPLSHAGMLLGYTCFAFDNDASIIKDVVKPIMQEIEKRPTESKEKEPTRGVEEFVVKPLGNPFMQDD